MNIDDLTIGQAKEIAAQLGGGLVQATAQDDHWVIGKAYLIRTVTHIVTGRLIAVTDIELWLEDAAWIADTGRYADALVSCEFGEVEPYPEGEKIPVGRGALVDACPIATLPRTQK